MAGYRSLVPPLLAARRLTALEWRRAYHSSVLPNIVSTASPDFQAKAQAMDGALADLQNALAEARKGGGEKEVLKMKKAGKKTPRERCVLRPSMVWNVSAADDWIVTV